MTKGLEQARQEHRNETQSPGKCRGFVSYDDPSAPMEIAEKNTTLVELRRCLGL